MTATMTTGGMNTILEQDIKDEAVRCYIDLAIFLGLHPSADEARRDMDTIGAVVERRSFTLRGEIAKGLDYGHGGIAARLASEARTIALEVLRAMYGNIFLRRSAS